MSIDMAILGTIVPAKKIWYQNNYYYEPSGSAMPSHPDISKMLEDDALWPVNDFYFNPAFVDRRAGTLPTEACVIAEELVHDWNGYLVNTKNVGFDADTEFGGGSIVPQTSPNGSNFGLNQMLYDNFEHLLGDYEQSGDSISFKDGTQVFIQNENAVNEFTDKFISIKCPSKYTGLAPVEDAVQINEIAALKLWRMPHNQQLESYTVTPSNPTEKSFTSMSGRAAKVSSCKSFDTVDMTFSWAEDNKTASKIYEILTIIKTYGTPLVYAEPMINGVTEKTRKLRLISLDSDPQIKHTSRGSYELTITGRCLT